jgi:hypothetical protein
MLLFPPGKLFLRFDIIRYNRTVMDYKPQSLPARYQIRKPSRLLRTKNVCGRFSFGLAWQSYDVHALYSQYCEFDSFHLTR